MKLSDLDFAVEDALDAIEVAVYHAEYLVDNYDGQWQDLNDMLTKMTSLLSSWREIIPPSVKEAIQGEFEYNANMEDFHRVEPY